jgi:general secretion pathway protein F
MMLLFVVPQFESLFAQSADKLPPASRTIMAASRMLRQNGLFLVVGLGIAIFALRQLLRQDGVKTAWDRSALRLPLLGELLRCVDAARFSRTLGALVDGNVALPTALALSRRTIANRTIGASIERVAAGVREGGGLAGPLAAANVLPRVAIGFIRTGEESSQLGPMLGRLADVLDRDVKDRLQKVIGIATPLITIILGATVAAIIASIMSAIIGFNDLALAP